MSSFSYRFWLKVRKTRKCWLWTSPPASNGYGQIHWGNAPINSHRASWLLHHGEIPEGLNVLHTCDNKLCVKPTHLFLGTHPDNVADKVRKDRQQRGVEVPQHRLTNDQVRQIRALLAQGATVYSIALAFGVSRGAIYHVKKMETWAHVVSL